MYCVILHNVIRGVAQGLWCTLLGFGHQYYNRRFGNIVENVFMRIVTGLLFVYFIFTLRKCVYWIIIMDNIALTVYIFFTVATNYVYR